MFLIPVQFWLLLQPLCSYVLEFIVGWKSVHGDVSLNLETDGDQESMVDGTFLPIRIEVKQSVWTEVCDWRVIEGTVRTFLYYRHQKTYCRGRYKLCITKAMIMLINNCILMHLLYLNRSGSKLFYHPSYNRIQNYMCSGAQPHLQSWRVQFLGLGYYCPSTEENQTGLPSLVQSVT